MGIGVSFFTEAVGAGPRKHMDMFGLAMNDGAALRISPTGTAQLAISVQTQGQGHETTFAQIVTAELGIPVEDVDVVHGDTDTTPYGLGTYGSRSTPVSGAAAAIAARKVRDRARIVAAAMLEVAPEDLEWSPGRWSVKGDPSQGASIGEIALASRGSLDLPAGVEAGLDAEAVYDPPNLTFPFGAYVCVVDIDPGTAHVKVRRFIAVDDCGVRINPMIVEGQIHGGLTDGVGMALMEMIAFDEDGNCLGGSLMDYLIPTAVEVPGLGDGGDGHALAAPSDRGQGGRRVRDRRLAAGDRQRDLRRARRHATSTCRAHPHESGRRCDDQGRSGRPAGERPRAVRDRDRRARGQAHERAPGRRRGRAGGRDDRGLRRRRLRAGLGAAARGARAGDRRGRAAAAAAGHGRDDDEVDGVVVAHNPCLSGGSLEIFLDPQLAAPRIVSSARRRSRGRWRTWPAPPATRSRTARSPEASDAALVVASHGDDAGDGGAGARAARPASATWRWSPARSAGPRCSTSLDVDAALRAQVHTPAGLDIGARSPADIAISILAQMIAERRAPVVAGVGDRSGLRDAGRGQRRDAEPVRRQRARVLLLRRLPRALRGGACPHGLAGWCWPRAAPRGSGSRSSCSRSVAPPCSTTCSTSRGRARSTSSSACSAAARTTVRRTVDLSGVDGRRQRGLRQRLLVLDRRGAAGGRGRRARAAARRSAGRDAGERARAARRPRRRAARGLRVRRRPRPPVRLRPLDFGELAALHGDKGVWKLLDRGPVADVPRDGPIPPDIDTWDDYRRVALRP